MDALPKYDGSNGGPIYDTSQGGHYGASAQIAAAGQAPAQELFTGQWANVNQGLDSCNGDKLRTYWGHLNYTLETENLDRKTHPLPLARIKKVMKIDPEVKMISTETPILFAKGCEIFIIELTMRAWIHAAENKHRTLQLSDIVSALGKSEMFDFLVDIVPRGGAQSHKGSAQQSGGSSHYPGQPSMHSQPPHHMPPAGHEPDMGCQIPGEHGFGGPQPMYNPYGPYGPYGQQMHFLDPNTYQQYGMGQP